MKVEYKGKVRLSLKIGDKVFTMYDNHNEGTAWLSKAFAMFLVGEKESLSMIPTYLMLQNQESGSTTWNDYLKGNQNISGRSYYYNTTYDNWITTLNSSISYESLIDSIASDTTDLFRLCLLDVNENIVAQMEVSALELSKIVPGTQAIVNWDMELVNQE